jgi:hypothetical protein
VIKVEFLVPIRDNDAIPFRRTDWSWLESQLYQLGGGFQRETGIDGSWMTKDVIYHDRCRRYIVSLESWMGVSISVHQ